VTLNCSSSARSESDGGFHGINIGLDAAISKSLGSQRVGRPSQRCRFIEQPIDPGLFEPLPASGF
jgi:hypothetical protein